MTDKLSTPPSESGLGYDPEENIAATKTMLPCPSCGETDVDAAFSLGQKPGREERYVNAGCMVCGMMGPDSHTPRDAADRWNALPRSTRSESAAIPDAGTEKILRDLLDRIYKMNLMAIPALRVTEHDQDSNDPLVAWMSDVRAVLYGGTKPVPDIIRDLQGPKP